MVPSLSEPLKFYCILRVHKEAYLQNLNPHLILHDLPGHVQRNALKHTSQILKSFARDTPQRARSTLGIMLQVRRSMVWPPVGQQSTCQKLVDYLSVQADNMLYVPLVSSRTVEFSVKDSAIDRIRAVSGNIPSFSRQHSLEPGEPILRINFSECTG